MTTTTNPARPARARNAFDWKAFKTETLVAGKLPFAIWEDGEDVAYHQCEDQASLEDWLIAYQSGCMICDRSYFLCYVDSKGKFHSSKSTYRGYLK